MIRRMLLVAALAVAVIPAGCGIVSERPRGYEKRDFVVDPSLRFRPVPLSDIMRNPQEGAAVDFEAILNRRDENVWQAYYTPFRAGEYKSFSVWPADAAVWDARGRGRSIPTLYMSVESPELAELYDLERYSPVRVRGVVRSVFDSRPWIQVHYIEQVGSPWFTDESIGALIRGLDDAQTNAGKSATLLEEALGGPLSPAGESAAWKALGWIHLSRKQYSEAEHAYTEALNAMPNDRQAADGLLRARRKAAPGPWMDTPVSADTPEAAADWKGMYAVLLTEHETNCKSVVAEHSKCGEMVAAMADARDAAVKAHAGCGEATEGMMKATAEKTAALEAERDELKKKLESGGVEAEGAKKSLEEKDAALKAATEKATALEAERDELKKKVEGGGAEAEGAKKSLEEKDGQIKTLNEKIAGLETERDELKKRAEAGGDPEALKKQIEEKEGQIKSLTQKATDAEQQVKDRDDTIKKQREEIDRLTEELKKKEGN